MNLLKRNWKRLACGLLALGVVLAAVVMAAPTPALAEGEDEPYVLTPDTHWFIGQSHHRQPWPNEEGSPVEYPFTVQEERMVVWFLMEADDSDAPKGYVLWQLFNESGKEVFSAYLMGFGYGYATQYFGYTLDQGTYTQRLTQVGCEGTVCSIALGAYTDPDAWIPRWPPKAQQVGLDATVTGKFDESHEATVDGEAATKYSKLFSFDVDEPTNVKFSAPPFFGATQLSLLDSGGTTIAGTTSPHDGSQNAYQSLSLDCGRLEPGTYYLSYETIEEPGTNLNALSRGFTISVKTGHEMYRLYNPWSGEHLYTQDSAERDTMVSNGWNYEGVAWYAPLTSDYPVYRFYNPNNGDHMYASSQDECESLEASGWQREEGVAFYSNDDPESIVRGGGVTIGRFFNPYNEGPGTHHFVRIDAEGKAEFSQMMKDGWNYEGKGWSGVFWG